MTDRPADPLPGADAGSPATEGATGSVDVRDGADRRRRPTPMLSRFFFVGRRRGGRRDGERERIYVDRPARAVVGGVVAVCILSIADAFLTLRHLALGATEANPLMRAALDLGDVAFVVVKTVTTILGAAFLGLHTTWRMGRFCLLAALAGYVLLTGWHIYGLITLRPHGA